MKKKKNGSMNDSKFQKITSEFLQTTIFPKLIELIGIIQNLCRSSTRGKKACARLNYRLKSVNKVVTICQSLLITNEKADLLYESVQNLRLTLQSCKDLLLKCEKESIVSWIKNKKKRVKTLDEKSHLLQEDLSVLHATVSLWNVACTKKTFTAQTEVQSDPTEKDLQGKSNKRKNFPSSHISSQSCSKKLKRPLFEIIQREIENKQQLKKKTEQNLLSFTQQGLTENCKEILNLRGKIKQLELEIYDLNKRQTIDE